MRLGYLTIVWGWGISMWELPNNPSHMILRPGQNMWSGRPLVLWINRQIGQQLVGKKLWWFLCLADSGIFVALISIFDIFFHHLVQPSVQSGGSATSINVLFKPFLGHILTFALFALSLGSTPLWHHSYHSAQCIVCEVVGAWLKTPMYCLNLMAIFPQLRPLSNVRIFVMMGSLT